MRVAVIGAGAVGALVALAAGNAGHDVTVCVRSPTDSLEVLRQNRSSMVKADFVRVAEGPVADVVLVTTKITDTSSVAPSLATLCGPETVTVAIQNGIDHVGRLRPHMPRGAGPVVPGLAYVAAERLEPGRVRHHTGRLLVVPAKHASIVSQCLGAGMQVRGHDDMVTACWRKLLANLVANPITALTLRPMDVMHSPGVLDMARHLLVEAVAVGRAEGADLSDSEVDRILDASAQFSPDVGSSMLHDRLSSRPMEHQFLTGEVVRLAARHGIDVPVNATLLALLVAVDQR